MQRRILLLCSFKMLIIFSLICVKQSKETLWNRKLKAVSSQAIYKCFRVLCSYFGCIVFLRGDRWTVTRDHVREGAGVELKQLTQPPGSQMSWLAYFCSAPPWSKTTRIYTLFAELRQHTNTTELHTAQCREEESDKQTVRDGCFQTEKELNLPAA